VLRPMSLGRRATVAHALVLLAILSNRRLRLLLLLLLLWLWRVVVGGLGEGLSGRGACVQLESGEVILHVLGHLWHNSRGGTGQSTRMR
jgi:hypothetical protein